MILTVIVEDEPLAIDRLRACLSYQEDVQILGEVMDGISAIDMINETRPALLFLDVRLPGASGFEVLRLIRHKPAVIFTTAHDQYALPAFEWGAFDYLLKPFDRERVATALDRYRQRSGPVGEEPELAERLQTTESKGLLRRFFVKQRGVAIPISTGDIVSIIAEGDYCRIHTKLSSYLIHLPLREFERRLEPARFLRVHRSAMVGISFIERMEMSGRSAILTMSAGPAVPASRAGLQELRLLHL